MTSLFVDSKELKVLIKKYPAYPIVVVPTKNLDYEKYWQKCIVISVGSRLWDDYES